MATFDRFEDMEVWKKSRELTNDIYRLTKEESFHSDPELRNQIRRAVISVTSNIAEGFERGGKKEFAQFLTMAKGSAGEVRSQLYLSYDQEYLSKDEFKTCLQKAEEISKMLSGLIKHLKGSTG